MEKHTDKNEGEKDGAITVLSRNSGTVILDSYFTSQILQIINQ